MAALASFDPVERSAGDRLLVRAADELHADSIIGDDTWAGLAELYDEQQLIEVCMVVGQYHLVGFTLNSLRIARSRASKGCPDDDRRDHWRTDPAPVACAEGLDGLVLNVGIGGLGRHVAFEGARRESGPTWSHLG